ncbi:MAG TPA: metallophosphoesterase [Candidatus Angelobacter sp.]|nr:metallophosphoesterase [Candidatus Angelobacter sp.]
MRLVFTVLLSSPLAFAQATIVQISDTHIGLSTAPNALQHLQTVVTQINAMSPQPDAVILSGDIGETTSAWTTAKNTLANLKAPVYFIPGNHDIHTTNISTYRQYFGNDYYSFKINNITFMVIDSQLLGDYDTFTSGQTPANVQPLPASVQTESDNMLAWLGRQTGVSNEIAVQHVPLLPQSLSGGGTYPSTNPYWAIYDVQNDTNIHHQYRTEEINALMALNITTMFAGHWHNQRNFTATSGSFMLDLRMAPAVAYAIGTGAQVGYTVHTISSTGGITTQFVVCSGCL